MCRETKASAASMEKWRKVWRNGIAPQLSSAGLQALERALIHDDVRLLQGITCYPPLIDSLCEREIEGACAIGFCSWQPDGVNKVGKIEAHFQRVCDAADAVFNEPASCRFFLNWYDDTPREEMRCELLGEVRVALAARLGDAA